MLRRQSQRAAISRTIVSVVVIVIIVVGFGSAYYIITRPSPSTTSSTSSTTSTSTTSTSSSVTIPQTLSIDDAYWPDSDLNMLYWTDYPNWQEYTVYQPLVTVNETSEYGASGVIQYLPGLADNWTVSSSGTTYTFNLRQNVNFSNGDPFNAYQVWMEMYGYYYLSANSSSWFISYPIFNMSPVSFGPATIAALNQSSLANPSKQALNIMTNSSWPIYVTGTYQIVFRLQAPFVYFPGTLTSLEGLMWDAQYVLRHGGFGTPTAINPEFNQHPIPGTGPYTVTGVSEDAYVQFTQNPTYWGLSLSSQQIAANPVLSPGEAKNVVIYYKSDDLTRYTDLSTGKVQIAAIEAGDWNLVTSNPQEYSYFTIPPSGGLITAIALNTQSYPTNVTDFRLAVVHAINYTDIIDTALLGKGTPFVGPEYPAWSQYYDLGKYQPYSYNTTLAEHYLNESGITNIPPITFTITSSCTLCTDTAQIVQSDLSQIGITVNIETILSSAYYTPYGSYSTNVQDASQIGQLSILGGGTLWSPDALTPADNWISFVSNSSEWGNWAAYSNPVVQSCVNAFTSTSNVTEIGSLCASAQTQIYDDAPYAWVAVNGLWYGSGSLVWNNKLISGFYVDPLWSGDSTVPLFNTVTFY